MTFTASLLNEMEKEALTTRKMLERVPDNQFDWQPHEKSMTLRALATHVAEIPGWLPLILSTSGIDFLQMEYKPKMIATTAELVSHLEESLAAGKKRCRKAMISC